MKRVLAVLLMLLVASALGACAAEETTTETGGDEATADDGGGEWVEVVSLKGSAAKTSAPFKLDGGEQRLSYKIDGGDMVMAAFYVEPKGTDLMNEGGFPVVMPDKAGKDTTRLNKDAGQYIIIVEAANCEWSVTLEEMR